MKKILIVGKEVSGFGGMETVFKTTYDELSKEKYDVSFVFFNELNSNSVVNDDWLCSRCYSRITSIFKNKKLKRLHMALKLGRFLKKSKPDYVIAYDPIGCFISRYAMRFSFVNIPLFSWSHFSIKHTYKGKYLLLANKHLSICDAITRQFIKQGVNEDDIYTIYNPIKRQDNTISRPEKASFIYVGRVMFDGQKNVSELFKALSNLRGDWTLHIIGSGEHGDINKLKAYSKEYSFDDKVVWHGWQTNPWQYIEKNIKLVTSLVITSNYEGFGMVIAEANSYGVYVISSNCPTGPSDIITPTINGDLYQSGDVISLTEKLQSLTDNPNLPNSSDIKLSVEKFYIDNYMNSIKDALK